MNDNLKRRSVVINRVKRIPFVVLLRRFLPLFIFIFIILLTFLFGLWNIRKLQYNTKDLKNVTPFQLDSSLSNYIGRNIFATNPNDLIAEITTNIGYVKEASVKKILPNTLRIDIIEHTPLYIGYSSNKCLLFSDTGELINEICKDCQAECTVEVSDLVYINSNTVIESNGKLIFFEEIFKVNQLLLEFNYEISSLNLQDGIALFRDTLGHSFTFDLSNQLEDQLARMYLIGSKINKDMIEYTTLDLRFERPVMNIK